MKKSILIKSAILIGLVLLSVNPAAVAQKRCQQKNNSADRGPEGPCMYKGIPDLTEVQDAKINELKTAHMKEMLKYRNQLDEKHAGLKTLQTAETVDMNKIYKVIEEIGSIEIDMAKSRAGMHQDIREILNDDQRVRFDTNATHQMMSCRKDCTAPKEGCRMKQ